MIESGWAGISNDDEMLGDVLSSFEGGGALKDADSSCVKRLLSRSDYFTLLDLAR